MHTFFFLEPNTPMLQVSKHPSLESTCYAVGLHPHHCFVNGVALLRLLVAQTNNGVEPLTKHNPSIFDLGSRTGGYPGLMLLLGFSREPLYKKL